MVSHQLIAAVQVREKCAVVRAGAGRRQVAAVNHALDFVRRNFARNGFFISQLDNNRLPAREIR